MIRTIRGGRDDARRFTPSGDIWTLRSARRADTEHDVDPVQREVAVSEGRSGERHVVEQRSEDEEECEADCDASDRGDHCFHRRHDGNLMWRCADQAHRGEALLAPGG